MLGCNNNKCCKPYHLGCFSNCEFVEHLEGVQVGEHVLEIKKGSVLHCHCFYVEACVKIGLDTTHFNLGMNKFKVKQPDGTYYNMGGCEELTIEVKQKSLIVHEEEIICK